ncbi:MAG: hypothetical protein ACOH1M_06645 [Rhodoglobus sp.]
MEVTGSVAIRRARRPPSAAESAEALDAAGADGAEAADAGAAGAAAGAGTPELSLLLIEPEGGGIVGSGEGGTVAAGAEGAAPVCAHSGNGVDEACGLLGPGTLVPAAGGGAFVGTLCPEGALCPFGVNKLSSTDCDGMS